MRFIFKTDYEDDIRLIKHGGQAFWYGLLVLALFGTLSIDAKRKRKLGSAWDAFAAETSNVPFAAILSGRNRFSAKEYFDWRFAVALLLFAGLLFAHVHIFGVSPFG